MLDSVKLWKRGVPAVAVTLDTFLVAAQDQAKAMAMPDIPLVVIPHLKAGETPEVCERKLHLLKLQVISNWDGQHCRRLLLDSCQIMEKDYAKIRSCGSVVVQQALYVFSSCPQRQHVVYFWTNGDR